MTRTELMQMIDEIIERYQISETTLGEAVGLSQSSINRYRGGRTFPNKERQNLIEDYYHRLKALQPEEGTGKVPIFTHMKKLYSGSGGAGENFFWQDEEAGWYEELDEPELDENLEYDRQLLEYQHNMEIMADGFYRYTPAAQKYLLEEFDLICMITDYDMEFVNRVRKLDLERKKQLQEALESVPISLSMLKYGNAESHLGFTTRVKYVFRDFEGKEHWHSNLPEKPKKLKELLRSGKRIGGKIFVVVDEESGQPTKKNNVENRNRFLEILYRIWQSDKEKLGGWIQRDFFQGIDMLLTYSEEDWYFLYLLSRMELAECSSSMESYKPRKYYTVLDHEDLLLKEYTLWQWLEGMLAEQEAEKQASVNPETAN